MKNIIFTFMVAYCFTIFLLLCSNDELLPAQFENLGEFKLKSLSLADETETSKNRDSTGDVELVPSFRPS
mgnify:CR=1 FL=1